MDIFTQHRDMYQSKVFDQMRHVADKDMLVDVILKVDQKRYPCHKRVLSTSSAYFEKMFLSGFKEQYSTDVELVGVSGIGFDVLYDYIYSGDIELTDANFQDVYDVSDMLLFDDIKEKVIRHMYRNLNHTTCVKYWLFSYQRNVTEMMTRCKSIMINMFDKVFSDNDDITDLPYEMIIDIIKTDTLVCQKEMNVLNQVNRWMGDHPKISDMQKNTLLGEIKWGLIHLNDFHENESHSPLESDWKSIVDIHTKANCNEKILLETKYCDYFQMRGSRKKVIVGTPTPIYKAMREFNIEMDDDVNTTSFVFDPAAVQVGNHVVVTGGRQECHHGWRIRPNTDAFDMKNQVWEYFAPMNEPRFQHVAIAFDRYILVLGGRDVNGDLINCVERYDIARNEWKIMKPFIRYTHMLGCCYHNDVYLCGCRFYDINKCHKNNCLYKYDKKEDEWIELCTIPEKDSFVSAICVYKDKIYIRRLFGPSDFLTFDPINLVLNTEIVDDEITVLSTNELFLPSVLIKEGVFEQVGNYVFKR